MGFRVACSRGLRKSGACEDAALVRNPCRCGHLGGVEVPLYSPKHDKVYGRVLRGGVSYERGTPVHASFQVMSTFQEEPEHGDASVPVLHFILRL